MGGPAWLPQIYRLGFFFLVLLFVLLGIGHIDSSCLDAADSAYLISADAVSHGMVPYRDFLAAHPPLLYLLGAPLARLGGSIAAFRMFSLLAQALLGFLTLRFALKLTRNPGLALLAGAFTLFAPVGVFFSRLFLNDSLASLLAVAMMLLLLGKTRRSTVAAGILAMAGTLAKLTFLPALAVACVYVYLYRRGRARLFLTLAVGGSAVVALIIDTATGGAYLSDILGAQASKGYSFTNFYEGLHRIWQFDWPLLLMAVPGFWFARVSLQSPTKARGFTFTREDGLGGEDDVADNTGRFFLLCGWLIAGLLVLVTLPAAGHDINLFQITEPVVALLAAWAVMGLAERGRTTAALAAVLLVIAVPLMVNKDRDFLARSNAADADQVVSDIRDNSSEDQPVLAPGCYAFEAGRPVALEYYDQFLWEEKYQRGDQDAQEKVDRLCLNVEEGRIAAVALTKEQPTFDAVKPELDAKYLTAFTTQDRPPLTLWLPRERPAPGGG